MADEALRALERDARSRPDDRAATLAYVRALERARDRPAMRLELCALARTGDVMADDALARWAVTGSPEPTATSIDVTQARAAVMKVRRRGVATPVMVTPTIALCVGGRELVAFSQTDRREAWTHPATECLVAAWGDDVVHLDERGRVVVRDASSGVERERLELPWAASIIRVSQGRVVVISDRPRYGIGLPPRPLGGGGVGSPERVACFDLTSTPAHHLWTDQLEDETVSVVASGRGLVREVSTGWDLDFVDLETGVVTRRRTRKDDSRVHAKDVITPDGRSLLLRTSHGAKGETLVNELDLASGDERWRLDLPWESRDLWGSQDLAVIRRRESTGTGVLVAIERATGRVRWEARPGSPRADLDALAIVGEQVIVAGLVEGDVSGLCLTSFAVADGRKLEAHELKLGTRMTERHSGQVRIVVASDAVRIAVAGRDVLALVEIPAA